MFARRDILAGLAISGLILPEAVAYAGIAGLPPERAVAAGIAGAVGYFLVGQSRHAVVAPTSSSAAILAATLSAIPAGSVSREGLATWSVLLTGLLFLLAWLLRLGSLSSFISRPVLQGFGFGLAITIILHQLPDLLGIAAAGPNLALFLADVFTHLPRANPGSLAIGCSALAFLLVVRRYPAVPGPLAVLVAGAVAAALIDFRSEGIAVIGPVHLSVALPGLPALEWPVFSQIAQYALPLVLILFAESWGTVRSLALRHGGEVGANRELAAFGAANLASALFRGMPVGAGFSAGNASAAAGAASKWTGLIAAAALLSLTLVAGGWIGQLPRALPAAVVIAALVHALDVRPFLRLVRLGRDHYLALGTAAGILCFGVLDGMMIAIVLSLVAWLRRLSVPVIARLARLPHSHDYVDAARHPDASAPADRAIFRPAAPLFYANAETVLGAIARSVSEDRAIRHVILSLEESFDLDTTALDQLIEFDRLLASRGLAVRYARVHDHLRDLIRLAGEADLLARCHYSVDDAVAAI